MDKSIEKRNILYLISSILSTLYIFYLIFYFTQALATSAGVGNTEIITYGLALTLVLPHLIVIVMALVFNWLAYLLKINWAGLVAGILYAVSMLAMVLYTPFVLVQTILCFVAYAKIRHKQTTMLANQNYQPQAGTYSSEKF